MGRRSEEPEWDSEEGSDEDGDDSSFDDEGSDDGSEEESDEEESDEDVDVGSESEEDDDDDEDDDGDEDSSDVSSDEDDDEDDDFEDVGFDDEEGGMGKRGMSSGSLMNEPGSGKPLWQKPIPNRIIEIGTWAAILFCFCLAFIPILILAVVLGVTLGGGSKDATEVAAPPGAPKGPGGTVPPNPTEPDNSKNETLAPLVNATVATEAPTPALVLVPELVETASDSFTTYTANAPEEPDPEAMLIANPANGDLPAAYSLVQFGAIAGIDGETSVEEYLATVEGATVDLCLTLFGDSTLPGTPEEYSACLIETTEDAIDPSVAGGYEIPASCKNGAVTTVATTSLGEKLCFDLAPLFVAGGGGGEAGGEAGAATGEAGAATGEAGDAAAGGGDADAGGADATDAGGGAAGGGGDAADATGAGRSLRGAGQSSDPDRRFLAPADDNFIVMLQVPEQSDNTGTTFHNHQSQTSDAQPTLKVRGANTCAPALNVLRGDPQFAMLVALMEPLADVLAGAMNTTTTLMAPTNNAFLAMGDLGEADPVALLQYHIAPGKVLSSDVVCSGQIPMSNGMNTTTLCGQKDRVFLAGSGSLPGANPFPEVGAVDLQTCTGVIHGISQLLVPANLNASCIDEEKTSTIADLCNGTTFTAFCNLLETVGMTDVFSSGLYTLFVPTDDAMKKDQADLSDLLADETFVTEFIMSHAVHGSAFDAKDLECDDTLVMANGQTNTMICDGDEFYIGNGGGEEDSKIVGEQTVGCNFIVHSIEGYILPVLPTVSNDNSTGMMNQYEPCRVCGAGKSVTNFDETIGVIGDNEETCVRADANCLYGNCEPDVCVTISENKKPCGCEEVNTVAGILASNDNYSTFYLLASSFPQLFTTMASTDDDTTLFAPTDMAFALVDNEDTELLELIMSDLILWSAHMVSFIEYHMVDGLNSLKDLEGEDSLTALNGEDLQLSTDKDDNLMLNEDHKLESLEEEADNGVVHAVGGVLFPPWFDTSIEDIVEDDKDLSTLYALIEQAGSKFLSGPFTLFAPTNEAIADVLPKDFEISSLDSETVDMILKNHIVEGAIPSSAIDDGGELSTLSENNLIFTKKDDTVTVNGAKISGPDLLASNGIIHVIDDVLLDDTLTALLE